MNRFVDFEGLVGWPGDRLLRLPKLLGVSHSRPSPRPSTTRISPGPRWRAREPGLGWRRSSPPRRPLRTRVSPLRPLPSPGGAAARDAVARG